MTDLPLTKVAEDAATITLRWNPVAGVGYRFTREKAGGKYSHTWDASRSTARFSRDSAWYSVQALGGTASGVYPPPSPPVAAIPKYGISTGASPTNAVLDHCKEIGAEYVRFDYSHDQTGIARVNRVHRNGQHVLLILRDNAAATAAYWRDKLPLRWYEIMNEPDLNGWSAAAYAPVAKRWCDELRQADPDCLISLPGHFKGRDAASSATEYARQVCATDADFDVWSVHFADDDTWNNPSSGWHLMFPHGDRARGDTIREILDASGRSGVPIMSSESHAFYREGPSGQAAKVTRFLGYTETPPTAHGQPLASVAIYRVDYNESGSFDSSLLNPDGSKRPAWQAFKDAAT